MAVFTREEVERCVREDGPDACLIEVRLQPGARKEIFQGIHDGSSLRIALRAPPVEGAANERLIEFLAEVLGVRRSGLALVSGHKNRQKRVRAAVARARAVEAILARGA